LYFAHRFFVAAMIRLRPAALIRRFFGAGAGFDVAYDFFISAQRFRCASAIRRRTAALRVRFLRTSGASMFTPAALRAGRPTRPSSCRWTSAIFESISSRWCSNPNNAAAINSASQVKIRL
jgi:hypothetical protein